MAAKDWVPFGLLEPNKPRHYREMLRIAWENKDHPLYATRILRHGVCDGCSLGPRGLKDDVMDGVHLCLTRLNLLRLNTMGPMDEADWSDIDRLQGMSNRELQALGRVPYPLLYEPGDAGFRRIGWDDALDRVAGWIGQVPPDRQGYFVTSRGVTNETYYVAQKLARLAGTNNVDLCSRLCHAPTVAGLKSTLGWGAPTCQLADFIGTDLVVLFGTDLANNQPVTTKYLHYGKKQGTRILVVNPVREPGLETYWIPSVPSSALFGTDLMDDFYQVHVGGDIAFIHGALKALLDIPGGIDRDFVEAETAGWDALEARLRELEWSDLEQASGIPKARMRAFAGELADADTAVLCYSMGLTQHAWGTDNVRAIVNLALARRFLGRDKCGIMPIRGHSGVQGGGACGVSPTSFPGGAAVDADTAARFSDLWDRPVPSEPGMMTGEMMEAAGEGRMDLLYLVGGNLLRTMPDATYMERALKRVDVRVHQDIVLNTSTVQEPGKAVLVLPAQTRYEQRTGGCTTSTERRIRFTPEIPGPRIGEAAAEWEILTWIGRRVVGADAFPYEDTQAIREEMEAAIPYYEGVSTLQEEGDWIQWGGPQLGRDGFPHIPDGRARFSTMEIPDMAIPDGMFQLSTRRGKQYNSMVFKETDPQVRDAGRDAVLLSARDADGLGVDDGDRVVVANDQGKLDATVVVENVAPRHVVMYWPECNVLTPRRYDPDSGVPDYNAFVTVEPRG